MRVRGVIKSLILSKDTGKGDFHEVHMHPTEGVDAWVVEPHERAGSVQPPSWIQLVSIYSKIRRSRQQDERANQPKKRADGCSL